MVLVYLCKFTYNLWIRIFDLLIILWRGLYNDCANSPIVWLDESASFITMTKGECLFAVLCSFEYVISSIVVISFSTWQILEYVASMLALFYLVMLSHDKYQMFYYEIEEPVSEEGSNDAFCPWLTLLNKIDLSSYSSQ